ncbi:MAG: hypothetical protein ABSD92_12000, partial [Candidatus Bathyarchaeia archaeon]
EKRKGITTDERRAKALPLEFLKSFPNYTVDLFEQRWAEFLAQVKRGDLNPLVSRDVTRVSLFL